MIGAVIAGVAACVAAGAVYRHQRLLKDRALLMRDAMRHRDFTFRLPTKGLLFGERALQDTLNYMGDDIQKLVARSEVESWERLTRVLTHEIMNVITPIRSISQAYIADPSIKDTPYEEGIRAIHDTSAGLAAFVDSYRKLTQLQEPMMKSLILGNFCTDIASLYQTLRWKIDVPPDVFIQADGNLLRQVFINIIQNAIEADARSIGIRYIRPKAGNNEKKAFSGKLLISNDGHVIPDDVAREIFIPFFTTKHNGSGIGLALSRQILLMQGLILRLADNSENGYNVTFTLEPDKA
ncbi:MAG: HAMP domain-containing histidine kinase [Muribaculaceae bacterium]|nr:HAMP domain-containing histidine kinase [Muribaculaceae bacterium]